MKKSVKRVDHGHFSNEDPQTQWCTEPGPDRNMTLVRDFYFDDLKKKWNVPGGYSIDGASIPRALWTAVGSPYTGDYRRASIPHDKACHDAVGNPAARLAADRMFYHACRAGGCSVAEATLLYLGVRLGSIVPIAYAIDEMRTGELGPRLASTAADQRLQADFGILGARLLTKTSTDDPKDLETEVSKQFKAYFGPPLVKAKKKRK